MSTTSPLSLYLHIPFCLTKCTYCAFNTYTDMGALVDSFIEALSTEVHILGSNSPHSDLSTIFFGGGTPSLLTPAQFDRIFTAIRSKYRIQDDAEITLESNPNDLGTAYLRDLRILGLNRISIGMQSAVSSELALFGRRHDVRMVIDAVGAARAAGFENVNLDLIYGIPGQTLENWRMTLRQALDLASDHLSLYALTLEGGTPLKADVEAGRVPQPDDDLEADMYDLATDMLGEAGYEQYEISNWTKPGYASRHNLQYWRNLPYAGVGPGAHGFAGGIRYSTVLQPPRYIQLLKGSGTEYEFPRTPATARAVRVDRETEISETLMMGLRLTQEGIRRTAFRQRFGVDLLELHAEAIEKFVNYGLLYVDDDVVRITSAGRFLSNAIIREFI